MTTDRDGPHAVDPTSHVNVLIVTDVRLYREGLAQLLGEAEGVRVLATSAPGELVFSSLSNHPACLVVADCTVVRTPGFVSRVSAAHPEAKVVAFAVAEEDEEEILACAEAGVAGFVPRNASVEEFREVLRSAAEGDIRCSPRVAAVIVRRVASLASTAMVGPSHSGLTRREGEIAALIDVGLSNKEIAARLHVSPSTVKNQVHGLLQKLRVRRRNDAVAAIRAGRVTLTARPHQGITV
jgi:DNA-binding NarL/FixJ family response regulator